MIDTQNKMKRGLLIVFEGIDKSGKSTQAKLLADNLNSLSITTELIRFPDRNTEIGKIIDSHLICTKTNLRLPGSGESSTHEEDQARINEYKKLHLLFSANRWENCQRITELLKYGTHVILDRYVYSGIVYAYNSMYNPYTMENVPSLEWVLGPDNGLPQPDIVFYLQIDPITVSKRQKFGEELFESIEFLQRVSDMFDSSASIFDYFKTYDASQSVQELHKSIITEVHRMIHFEEYSDEIKTLWNLLDTTTNKDDKNENSNT